mmetsp:Transcript_1164/g.3415  ORF Transcript_1164/g.3415 Transcript_1164/m.3415 type:complete len:165 (-) Transcript_1164:627-1121(-)
MAETIQGRVDSSSGYAAFDRCECGSLSTVPEYFQAFGVRICSKCKSLDELLPKGKAKQLYLLTDADIGHLGSIKRDNPMKSQWTSMRLYLRSQLEDVAIHKFGSFAALEQQRRSNHLQQNSKRERDRTRAAHKDESLERNMKVSFHLLRITAEGHPSFFSSNHL